MAIPGPAAQIQITQGGQPATLPLVGVSDSSGAQIIPPAAGTPGTGITQPTGGSGQYGWLSGIYNKLTALATAVTSGALNSASTVAASDASNLPIDALAQTLAYSNGLLSTITVTYNANTYVRTLSYTNGLLSSVSNWVKQ